MKKTLILSLLIVTVVAFSLAQNVTVWFSWEGQNEFMKIVKAFEETHPNVNVNVVYIPNMIQKINITLASGGEFPDVALIRNDYIGILARAGVIHEVGKVNALNKIYDSFLFNKKEYAYPYYADVQVVYANKALFKHIALPSWNWTISDFEKVSSELKNEGKAGAILAEFSPYFFVSFDAAFNDGKLPQKDDIPIVTGKGTMKAMEFYNSLFNVKKIAISYEKMAMINAFKNGKAGFFFMGSFLIPDLIQSGVDFTLLPYPYLQKGTPIPPVLDSKGFAVFKDSQAVREFLDYVTSAAAEKEFCLSTYKLPANPKAAMDLGQNNEFFNVMKLSEERALILPTLRVFKTGYMRGMKTALRLCLSGQMELKKALDRAQQYIQAHK